MTQIRIKVRLAENTLYNLKLTIDFTETVGSLKILICDSDNSLSRDKILLAYCGQILDDSKPLYTYNLFENAMLHLFIEVKPDNENPPRRLLFKDMAKLTIAIRSLQPNSAIRNEFLKLRYPEAIGDLILSTPGLNVDVTARTLLQHPELLSQVGNSLAIKALVEYHPALAAAMLQIANETLEIRAVGIENNPRNTVALQNPVQNNVNTSDEEDMDVSMQSTSSEDNTLPVVNEITTEQLASALANVIPPQPQPSTSGTSTSATQVGTVVHGTPRSQTDVDSQLQLMRDMGLTNDSVNREALEHMGNLEAAIDLVMSGYKMSENNQQNNQ